MDMTSSDGSDFEELAASPIYETGPGLDLDYNDQPLETPSTGPANAGFEYFSSFNTEHSSTSNDGQRQQQRLRWSQYENSLLRRLCAEERLKDWPYIAMFFPFHTQKQVRRHYYAIRKTWTTNTSVSVLPEPVPVEECKHEFMEELKNRVNALETQLTLTTNRLQDIIKKYSN